MTPRAAALGIALASALAALAVPLSRAPGLALLAAAAGVAAGRTWTWRWAWTASLFVAAAGLDAPLGTAGTWLAAAGLAGAAWVPPPWRAAALPLLLAPGLAMANRPVAPATAGLCLAAALLAFATQNALARIPPRPSTLRAGVRAATAAPGLLLAAALLALPVLAPASLTSLSLGLASAALALLAGLQCLAALAAVRSGDRGANAWTAGTAGLACLVPLSILASSVPTRPLLAASLAAAATGLCLAVAWLPIRRPVLRTTAGAAGAALVGLMARPLVG